MEINNFYTTNKEITIDYLSINSKDILKNTLFFCIKGNTYDGHNFAEEAVKNGAVAVVSERELNLSCPTIIVKSSKKELARVSNLFYNHPSKKLNTIAVTGTDGKTSTSLIIKHLLGKKHNCGYIGTNGIMFNDEETPTDNTTPNSILLNKTLNDMLYDDVETCIIETSSHAISYHKIDYIDIDIAVFTNISHEHLDYHQNMNKYFNTKLKLFESLNRNKLAIINLDENVSDDLLVNSRCNYLTYSIHNKSDFQATNIRYHLGYTVFDLKTSFDTFKNIYVNLFGEFNIYNVLPAIIIGLYYKMSIKEIKERLMITPQIEGRMYFVETSPYNIIVDFAHTPNALKSLLLNLRKITDGNIIIVIGAAGNRDKSKRPAMGQIASSLADFVIFTSEDPKDESLESIFFDLTSELSLENYILINNRKQAIKEAINNAKTGDTVVITGKGNEQFENIDNILYEHNDIIYATTVYQDIRKKSLNF